MAKQVTLVDKDDYRRLLNRLKTILSEINELILIAEERID